MKLSKKPTLPLGPTSPRQKVATQVAAGRDADAQAPAGLRHFDRRWSN